MDKFIYQTFIHQFFYQTFRYQLSSKFIYQIIYPTIHLSKFVNQLNACLSNFAKSIQKVLDKSERGFSRHKFIHTYFKPPKQHSETLYTNFGSQNPILASIFQFFL